MSEQSGTVRLQMKKQSQLAEIGGRFIKNKLALCCLIIILLIAFCAIFADYIAPYGYDDQNLADQFISPCLKHPFGTDEYGRDIFSRIIYGARISLTVGLVSVSFSCVVGVLLGCLAGYYGGRLDNIIMRFVDILLAIPNMLLSISIAATLGPGLGNLMIAVGISSIAGYARIVRANILSIKEQEYIEAASCIGASEVRIILRHVLPNTWAPIIIQATMSIANAILSTASLSFIGLGITAPTPEWGAMLSSARAYIRDYWYMVVFPGLMIMTTVFALNIMGDGLRDALDPRLKN